MDIQLAAIGEAGRLADRSLQLSPTARQVCEATAARYRTSGFAPPWLGYLAVVNECCVGSCAFTSQCVSREVEIAYFTFPGFEHRGIATAMARTLIRLARASQVVAVVTAQTLPEAGASTHILEKLGFTPRGTVVHPQNGDVWEWALRLSRAPLY